MSKPEKRLKEKSSHPKEEREDYPTQYPLALAISQTLRTIIPGASVPGTFSIIEPSAGGGNFVRAIRETWPEPTQMIHAVDIWGPNYTKLLEAGASHAYTEDWVSWVSTRVLDDRPALVIGNPPFSLAASHLQAGFQYLPRGSYIALLLRMSFLGSHKRNNETGFWNTGGYRFLDSITPLIPRPTFVRGTHDNSEYGLYVWDVNDAKVDLPMLREALVWRKE